MCINDKTIIEPLEATWCGVRLKGQCYFDRDSWWEINRVQLLDPWRGAWLPGPHIPAFAREHTEHFAQDGVLTASGRARAEDLLVVLAENLNLLDAYRLEALVDFERHLREEIPRQSPDHLTPEASAEKRRLLGSQLGAHCLTQQEYQQAGGGIRSLTHSGDDLLGWVAIQTAENLSEKLHADIHPAVVFQLFAPKGGLEIVTH